MIETREQLMEFARSVESLTETAAVLNLGLAVCLLDIIRMHVMSDIYGEDGQVTFVN
jgi:hypothetical protein